MPSAVKEQVGMNFPRYHPDHEGKPSLRRSAS
jgi:hypothetical protein